MSTEVDLPAVVSYEKIGGVLEPSDDPNKESKRLLLFCRSFYYNRPPEFGIGAMKNNMELAHQIWNKELSIRKSNSNVINQGDDLSQYGMPSLMLVKVSAFLFLLVDEKYDPHGSIHSKIYTFLKESPCYKVIAEECNWILGEMCDKKAPDRDKCDDQLGLALNIVSDTEMFKFIGYNGFRRRERKVYHDLDIDEDTELDRASEQKIHNLVLNCIDKYLLNADLNIYFRTKSGILMATECQNKLKVYIDTKYRLVK
jgi:hypothetical protein